MQVAVTQKSAALPFTVMAKPVGSQCNLSCGYCYYRDIEQVGTTRMSDEILEIFIRQYIEASGGPTVYFTWHGGEPTLAGLDFYRLAVELQKRFLPDGWSCWNNLQTNGVLLDDEWCAFLAAERFDVGLSIDGTKHLHDMQRKRYDGSGTYQAAVNAIRSLHTHGIKPDILCTVTSFTAKESLNVYRALRDLDTGWIQFIPILRRNSEGELTDDSVSGEAYGKFLCDIFDEWVLNDLGRTDIQLFAETLRIRAGGSVGLCWMAPTCGRSLIVERDGSVYSCDHFVKPKYRLGMIKDFHLRELANLPEQIIFGENKRNTLPAQCRRCPWLAVCGGGCSKDRFALSEDGEPSLNHLCVGLKRFFSYTQPVMKLIASLQKKGFFSESIMTELRKRLQTIWKNIGRNDPCPCENGRKAKQCCWDKRL